MFRSKFVFAFPLAAMLHALPCMAAGTDCGEAGAPGPSARPAVCGEIVAANGGVWYAVENGGIGGPNSGPLATALHTDATVAGPWETFTLERIDDIHFALRTVDGHYLTAVNGGRVGQPPTGPRQPILTNGRLAPLKSELRFKITVIAGTSVTLQTADGHFITAVNGGGIGGINNVPFHTDALKRGSWETFSWVGGESTSKMHPNCLAELYGGNCLHALPPP